MSFRGYTHAFELLLAMQGVRPETGHADPGLPLSGSECAYAILYMVVAVLNLTVWCRPRWTIMLRPPAVATLRLHTHTLQPTQTESVDLALVPDTARRLRRRHDNGDDDEWLADSKRAEDERVTDMVRRRGGARSCYYTSIFISACQYVIEIHPG